LKEICFWFISCFEKEKKEAVVNIKSVRTERNDKDEEVRVTMR